MANESAKLEAFPAPGLPIVLDNLFHYYLSQSKAFISPE
jgi:hypothetical protein